MLLLSCCREPELGQNPGCSGAGVTWGQAELSSLAFLVFLNTVGTLLKAALWKIHNRILLIRVPPPITPKASSSKEDGVVCMVGL